MDEMIRGFREPNYELGVLLYLKGQGSEGDDDLV